MSSESYDFDVALSFGWKDEEFANRLCRLLEGRLRVFLYLKRQEMLAGTDGEQIFNEIFGKCLDSFDPLASLEMNDIRTAIRNATGPRSALFIPEDSFELAGRCMRFGSFAFQAGIGHRCDSLLNGRADSCGGASTRRLPT